MPWKQKLIVDALSKTSFFDNWETSDVLRHYFDRLWRTFNTEGLLTIEMRFSNNATRNFGVWFQ